MKTILLTLASFVLTIQNTFSQNNNLVVYSQDGFKFSLILNGIRQNVTPQTNVKVTGLNAPNYQVKVIFENKMPDLNESVYLMRGGEQTQNSEYNYSIKRKKDNSYKLSFNSLAPISEMIVNNDQPQTVVVYHPEPIEQTTTTTTVSQTVGTISNENVSMGMGVNGMGFNMNINVNDGSAPVTNTTTTYSTTTTTTSGYSDTQHYNNNSNINNNKPTYVLEGYNGVYGCPYPMSPGEFESAKQSVKSKNFDDSRLTIAKQIIGSNCLLCSQIKELMLLITFEDTRLELAKFAWSHNLDKGNYYKLNDAFKFESSIDELNAYTQGH